MISALLVVVLLLAIALTLLAILGVVNGLSSNIQEAGDTIHLVRCGLERDRHRFQEAIQVVERIELHLRGPGRDFISPAPSPYTDELPNP